MKQTMRSNPINILERTSKYLILLLLPLVRTVWELFVSFQFDLVYSWLSSVRWTLIVVWIILALGWYEWYRFRFSFEPYGLLVLRGIFLQKELKLRYAAVTSVSLVAPWYYRPFGIVRLAFDTDAGNSARTDFSITIRDLKLSNGAGFVVAYAGDIMTMPGLPKVPAAEKIDVDDNAVIHGLF